jgi:AraC-like DNA-binding protein
LKNLEPINELNLEFDNFEEFNEGIRGWSTNFVQVDRGVASVKMRHRMTNDINALDLQFSHSTYSVGAPEAGRRVFGMVDRVPGCTWCGYDVTPNQILRFDLHEEFASCTPKGFVARTLSVDEKLIASVSERLGIPELVEFLDRSGDVLSADPVLMEGFRGIYDRPHYSGNDLVVTVQQFIGLIAGNCTAFKQSRRKITSRKVDEALLYIGENAHMAITVADVCEAIDVDYRSLDRAFKERLGHGPKDSILAVRLQGVRRALIDADVSSRIIDVAGSWGFWHMSDFARVYRNEFGELPSDTLKYKAASCR